MNPRCFVCGKILDSFDADIIEKDNQFFCDESHLEAYLEMQEEWQEAMGNDALENALLEDN